MRPCEACSAPAEAGDRFCGRCGGALQAPGRGGTGEGTETSLSAAEVNSRLGRVYLARGKREAAACAWRKALALRPDDRLLEARLEELERAIEMDRHLP